MLIEKLLLKNFKSYKDLVTIDLSVKDPSKNIILIWWENGAWKTSFLEAINTIFYWASPLKIKEYMNDQSIIEWNANCMVWLVYRDDNNDQIKIERERTVEWRYNWNEDNITSQMIRQEFKAWKNWSIWNIDVSRWQEEVDVKLPKWVSEFFFFEWEKIWKIAEDSTSKELKTSIEKVIWLERINTLINDLNSVSNKLQTGVTWIKDDQVDSWKAKIKVIDVNIKKEQINKENYSEQLKEKQDLLEVCEEKYSKIVSEWDAEELQRLNTEISSKEREITEIDIWIQKYLSDTLPFSLLWPFYKNVKENIKKDKEYRSYLSRKESNTELKEKLINWLYIPQDIVTGRPWNEDMRPIIESRLSDILEEWKRDPAIFSLTDADANKILALWDLNYKSDESIELINKKESLTWELRSLQHQRDSLSTTPEKIRDQKKLIKERSDLSVTIASLKSKIEDCDIAIKWLMSQKNDLFKELKRMQQWYEAFNEVQKKLNKIDKISNALKQYKEKLRQSKVETLTKNIELMFKKTYSKANNIDRIHIDPETFDIQIIDINWLKKPKRDLSEWEKAIFAISTIWWLSKTSNYDLPIVVDAPLSPLSDAPINDLLKNYFPNAWRQVVILTKRRDLKPWSEEYKMLEDHIEKSYVIDYDLANDKSIIKEWYFF